MVTCSSTENAGVRALTFVMDKEKKEEGEGERKKTGKKGTEEKKQLRIT